MQIIIIWPDTRIKFNTLEKQCQNIIKNEQVQHLVKDFILRWFLQFYQKF